MRDGDTGVVAMSIQSYYAQAERYSALDSQLVCSCFVYSKSHKFDFDSTLPYLTVSELHVT